MTTNKYKQNLRMKRICEKFHKKIRYDGFDDKEIKYIKTVKEYERVDRELNKFYSICKRTKHGQVDWNSMSEDELDYFDYIYKKSEKLLKMRNKLEDEVDADRVMELFMKLNIRSVSF